MTRDPFYQNQLEVLKQKETEVIGDLEEQVLARPVSQEIPDVSDAGMLPAQHQGIKC